METKKFYKKSQTTKTTQSTKSTQSTQSTKSTRSTRSTKKSTQSTKIMCLDCNQAPISIRGLCKGCYEKKRSKNEIQNYTASYANTRSAAETHAYLEGLERRMAWPEKMEA